MTISTQHDSPRPLSETVPRILENTVGMLDEVLEARRQLFASVTELATTIVSSMTDAVRDAGARDETEKA